MALPRASLSGFLATAKSSLNNAIQHAQPVTLVIGNESADLDSICSAIIYAYIRTYTSIPPSVHVPIANIPASDISLRPELSPVLSHAGIKSNELITLSDLPHPSKRKDQLAPEKTRWHLVDHNSLQGELGQLYSERVVGCIDHHDEENKVPKNCGSEPRIVEKSGSCASLIVNHCRGAWGKSEQDDNAPIHDIAWARMALAPILIDTSNLRNKDKVTKNDLIAAESLEQFLGTSLLDKYDRDTYYTEINDGRYAINDLSLNDMLRKDYKQWTEGQQVNLGISSTVKEMNYLLTKAEDEDAFWREIRAFAEDDMRKLSVYAIMTTFVRDGEFCRELLVLGLGDAGINAARNFEKEVSEELGLQGWESERLDNTDGGGLWRRCWKQTKVGMSRKQVGPLLRKAII